MTFSVAAQTAGPQPAAAQAAPAPVPPQAVPAKIALIEFEQVAAATNEGQRSLQELQKKYEPKKAQLDALATEIDTLTKQLQAAPASMPEEERGIAATIDRDETEAVSARRRGCIGCLQRGPFRGDRQGGAEDGAARHRLCEEERLHDAAGHYGSAGRIRERAVDAGWNGHLAGDCGCLQCLVGSCGSGAVGTFGEPSAAVCSGCRECTEACDHDSKASYANQVARGGVSVNAADRGSGQTAPECRHGFEDKTVQYR